MAVTLAVPTARSLEEAIRAVHMVEDPGVLVDLVDRAVVSTAIVFFNAKRAGQELLTLAPVLVQPFNPRMMKA
ncbi:hypothetical protein [Paenibacillus sp. 1A_MP2]|uniref:hypothetical protein n=1 Tax=Paenibacillus sp. 1A_MP2 TaxID=3457495 RepID=UPI003FCEE496